MVYLLEIFKNGGSFHGELLNNQMVIRVYGEHPMIWIPNRSRNSQVPNRLHLLFDGLKMFKWLKNPTLILKIQSDG